MAGIPLTSLREAIAYPCPAHSQRGICWKRPSFEKGEVPDHLESFAEDAAGTIGAAAVECEGETGQDFAACMRRETAHLREG